MFSLSTLFNKLYNKSAKGDMIVDLTRSSIDHNVEISTEAIVVVPEDYEMRPDLIALSVYGDDSKVDYILKYNCISNPFSVYEGQVLEIPDKDDFEKAIKLPDVISDPEDPADVNFTATSSDSVTNKSDHIKSLEEKANTTILPPNVNSDEEDNIKIENGKISLGNNSNDTCDVNKSRARVKARLLRNMM